MIRRQQIVCPAKCSGGRSGRQNELTELQIAEIDGVARQHIDQNRGGLRCSYCGAVYIHGGRVLGFLDDGIMGPGWHPKGGRSQPPSTG